jgi:hypothetical protein
MVLNNRFFDKCCNHYASNICIVYYAHDMVVDQDVEMSTYNFAKMVHNKMTSLACEQDDMSP